MKFRTGATLQGGKYLLGQALGNEGVSVTYLGTQTALNQAIVIKTLDPALQATPSFPHLKMCFLEETRLLARCQHPSIVRVLDFFEEENLPFLVMQHVPGQTLAERVSVGGVLFEAEAIHYVQQIGSALSVLHQVKLAHRNLKPQSIIRRQGTNLGVLVGFGFVHGVTASSILQTSSNEFTPPDAISAGGNPFAIDIYALAATLFYLLTGQPPTGNLSIAQCSWTPNTKQAILRGMSRDPALRPQSIEEWLRLLPNVNLPLTTPFPQNAHSSFPIVPQNSRTVTAKPIPAPAQNTHPQNGHSKPASSSPERIVTSNGKTATPNPSAVPTKSAQSTAQPSDTEDRTIAIERPSVRKRTQLYVSSTFDMNRHLPKFLMLTIAGATAMGVGFGLALRISAAKAPGTGMFQPTQSFADKEWKGTLATPKEDVSGIEVESNTGSYDNDRVDNPTASGLPKIPEKGVEKLPPLPTLPKTEIPESPIREKPLAPNPILPRREPTPVETAPAIEPDYTPPADSAPSTPPVDPAPPIAPTTPIPSINDPTPPISPSNLQQPVPTSPTNPPPDPIDNR